MVRTSSDIRKSFLDFFIKKSHHSIPSSPLVVKDDPTLMFTNAGMNQFKQIFLGNTEIKYSKVVNSQKCLRVSGKHNDLEEVGHDTYHHTMFEMLGNWSFGDYFKEEAIDLAWEFLIEECNLPKERIYITFFSGDNQDNLKMDLETFNIWKKYVSEDKILSCNKKDNFWEMGEVGPCGPSSEIHFDNRSNQEREKICGSTLVNKDHPEVIEIWNLVFIQYNRKFDKSLESLPNKHIDTGMGFERLCMIMQNKRSNYDTDIFMPLINAVEEFSMIEYGNNEKTDVAMRVISDHIRAIAFSIADGQVPSNVKAGYVIRRILRRAVRYGYTFLNIKSPFMYQLTDVLCDQMGDIYPELHSQRSLISRVIKNEEEAFLRTLSEGLKRLSLIIKNTDNIVSGKLAFELYDTYGFPLDLTSLILTENNLKLDLHAFEKEMKIQKVRSKKATEIISEDWIVIYEDDVEEFIGYNRLECDIKITRYRKVKLKEKELYQLVFNLTPFYPEGGGQVGDTGIIRNKNEDLEILDTKKENNLIVHLTNTLPNDLKNTFHAIVDRDNRDSISKNHSATHLLHHALRKELGIHVEQKGSLVCADYLRFDFTHFQRLTDDQIRNINTKVNKEILNNTDIEEHKEIPFSEAKDMGAIMLFGETYADVVRIIQFGDSLELCGGTHVNSLSEIGGFKILSEGSASAGIRRIEAITGNKYKEHIKKMEETLNEIESLIKNKDVVLGVKNLIKENKSLLKEIDKYRDLEVKRLQSQINQEKEDINGIGIITREIDLDIEGMKSLSFNLRKLESNLVVLLASKKDNKVLLTLMVTEDLIKEKNMDASLLIKEISKEINGSGGGQSFFATAGGSKSSGIKDSFQRLIQILKK